MIIAAFEGSRTNKATLDELFEAKFVYKQEAVNNAIQLEDIEMAIQGRLALAGYQVTVK